MVTHTEMMGEAPAEEPKAPSLITGEMMTRSSGRITQAMMMGDAPVPVPSGFGWKDAAQIADLLLGVPAWLATMGARGALDIGATIRGIPDPMQASSEKIEAALQTPWMRFLQSPIQTTTGMETEGTMVGKGLEAVSEGIVDLGEYLAKETGYEGFKELMPRLADLAMVGAGKAGHVAVTKFKARNARLLKEAQAAMEKEVVKQEADAHRAMIEEVKGDPYFDQFPELPIWLTKEKVAAYVETLKADPKVEAKLGEMAKKPMKEQVEALQEYQAASGKTVTVEDFWPLREKVGAALKKPMEKLRPHEQAMLEDYNARMAAEGGFIDGKMAPYIFATLGAGSIAATYAVAQYFQEQEAAEALPFMLAVGGVLIGAKQGSSLRAVLDRLPVSSKLLDRLPEGRVTFKKQHIEQELKRKDITEPERATFKAVLEGVEGDTISARDLGEGFAGGTREFELTAKPSQLYNDYGLERIGRNHPMDVFEVDSTTTLYDLPMKVGGRNHFNDPNLFGWTRSFIEEPGVRHVVEIQSDLAQHLKVLGPERRAELEVRRTNLAEELQKALKLTEPERSASTILSIRRQILETRAALTAGDVGGELAPILKNWPRRLIREELVDAAKGGDEVVRFATADTVTKVEGWLLEKNLDTVPAALKAKLEHAQIETEQGSAVGTGELFWNVDSPHFGPAGLLVGTRLTRISKAQISSGRFIVEWEPVEKFPKLEAEIREWADSQPGTYGEMQGIYDRYAGEITRYLKTLGGKKIMDEFDHTWIEVPTASVVQPRGPSMQLWAAGAATVAVASQLDIDTQQGLLAGVLAVTKAKRLKLNAKLKAAPSDLFRNKILVEGARAGDPAAIEKIYTDNAKPLERSIATFNLPPGIDAADVVARVMEKFFTDTIKRPKDAKGGFRGDAKVSSFLYGAVRNEATNAMQRGKLSERSLQETAGPEGRSLEETTPDVSSNLEVAALNEQLGAKMEQALQDLPKNYRDVAERILLEGKSYEQTAQELNIPVGTVRSQLSRAKAQLQGKLREYSDREAGKADPVLLGLTGLAGTAAALGAYLDSDQPIRGAMLGALGVPGFYWLRKVGVGEGLDQALGSLSTRLELHGNTALKFRARNFERRLMEVTDKALTRVHPFLKGMRKLSTEAQMQLNQALLMNDFPAVAEVLKGKPEMVQAWKDVQGLLAEFRKTQISLGRFKKGLTNYFPRIVKDYEGLKKALGQEARTHLESALIKAEAKMQKDKTRSLTVIERAIIIDNSLKFTGSTAQLPSSAKARSIRHLIRENKDGSTTDLTQFYEPSTDALLRYISSAVKDIEIAKFFGAHLKTRKIEGKEAIDINDSIGQLVESGLRDGSITYEGADAVRGILRSRFLGGEKTPHESIQAIRDVTNIALLGNILSAATQLGDAPMSLYHHGLRPTLEALKGKLTGDSQISTKDFGMVNHVVEELASAQGTGRWVQTAFKWSGFSAIDQFGKNLNLQAGLIKNQRLARTEAGRQVLLDRYGEAFGQEFMQLITDLKEGKITDRVKSVLFSELSDAQPISKMEMPQAYNAHPNGRILWQMKSFMLKQADVIRRDGFQEIAKGNYVKGAKAIAAFSIILAAAQAPAKMVKDWISGREVDFDIDLVQNLLETFGISRYTLKQIDTRLGRGIEDALTGMVTPPIVSITADILDKPKKIVKYIPGLGRAIYDRELGGNEARARAERRRQGPLTAVEKRAAAFRRKIKRMRNPKR